MSTVVLLLVVLCCLHPAAAQSIDDDLTSRASRDRAYQALADEVTALERQGNVLKKVVRLVEPTVAHIEAAKSDDYGLQARGRSLEEAGSGAIIEYKGNFYIVTNRHVIHSSGLADIKIRLWDGRELHPDKVWADPGTDIAVMKVSAPDLVPARLGQSRNVEIGDFVMAVGSPFGLSHSVTFGIVSAKGRRDLKLGDGSVRFQNFLQTDAAINPGNSGGPLVNLRGEVIGINTAIASNSGGNEGIGFSIPIDMAMVVAEHLIERGRVVRAFLGVQLNSRFGPLTAAAIGLPRPRGAQVSGITPNSPAESSDIQVGDVILVFDGREIEDDNDLINRASLTPVGKEVDIVLFRQGKLRTVRVKVGDRSRFDPR